MYNRPNLNFVKKIIILNNIYNHEFCKQLIPQEIIKTEYSWPDPLIVKIQIFNQFIIKFKKKKLTGQNLISDHEWFKKHNFNQINPQYN